MPWVLTLDDTSMSEEDITAGEMEVAFTVACNALPHAWQGFRPTHCPVCLNAHLVALLIARTNTTPDLAAVRIATMRATAALDCLTIVGDTTSEGS